VREHEQCRNRGVDIGAPRCLGKSQGEEGGAPHGGECPTANPSWAVAENASAAFNASLSHAPVDLSGHANPSGVERLTGERLAPPRVRGQLHGGIYPHYALYILR
jgi:hypothetical protein